MPSRGRSAFVGVTWFLLIALSCSTRSNYQSSHPRNAQVYSQYTHESNEEAIFVALESFHTHTTRREAREHLSTRSGTSVHSRVHRRRLERELFMFSFVNKHLQEEDMEFDDVVQKERLLPEQEVEQTQALSLQLRELLLENYDKNAYPWEAVWKEQEESHLREQQAGNTTTPLVRTGLPVELGLNVHKVFALDVKQSTSDLVVWLRLKWKDPRLAWDHMPEFENITTSFFYIGGGIGGGEASEIWTPDIYLWNQAEPLGNTLTDTYATISSDGSVFWSRPGRLKSTCKYKGFNRFPFDTLSCVYEFGSWARGLQYIDLQPFGEGFVAGGSETAEASFEEFGLEEDSVVVDRIVYGEYDNGWPVLLYKLAFQRRSIYYMRGVLLLYICLNIAAFCCFWIPPALGERTMLSITCVLASIASELVIADKIPVCSQISWYRIFATGSTLFAIAVVFQCVAVIFFHFYTGYDLVPKYIRWLHSEKTKAPREYDSKAEREQSRTEAARNTRDNTQRTESVPELNFSRMSFNEEDMEMFSSSNNENTKEVGMEESHASSTTKPKPESEQERRSITFGRYENRRDEILARAAFEFANGDENSYRNVDDAINNAYWKFIAKDIDEYSRILFPIGYAIFLGVVWPMAYKMKEI